MKRRFPARPEVLKGVTDSVDTPVGRAYVTLNFHDGDPIEVFVVLGKAGTTERASAEAIGRLCSVALQHEVPLHALTRQLRGISSEEAYGLGPRKVLSLADAVGRTLEALTHTSEAVMVQHEDDNPQERT